MRDARRVTLNNLPQSGAAASPTSPQAHDFTNVFSRYPIASLCAAGALGYAIARLVVRDRRSKPFKSPRRSLTSAEAWVSTSPWPTAEPPKAHGDKLANAVREAATRTYAPTYPEG